MMAYGGNEVEEEVLNMVMQGERIVNKKRNNLLDGAEVATLLVEAELQLLIWMLVSCKLVSTITHYLLIPILSIWKRTRRGAKFRHTRSTDWDIPREKKC